VGLLEKISDADAASGPVPIRKKDTYKWRENAAEGDVA